MAFKERRLYKHIPFSAELTIVDRATRRRYKGYSINLSLSGIGFYGERFLEAGTPINILVHLGQAITDQPEQITAMVRWARVEGDGAIMGAEFDSPVTSANMPQLCERLYTAGGA